jgi:transglutaminase-like putative cysteine protease
MYTPDTDKALEMKKGICFDYAAVVATMLRSQNIPTKLVFGYAPNGEYHSWNEVFVNGTWMHLDATWGRMNSTGYTVSTIH